MASGYLYEEVYSWWDTGTAAGFLPSDPAGGIQPLRHYETPDTKRRIHELIAVSGLIDHLTRLRARPATHDELTAVHDSSYVDGIIARSNQPRGGDGGDAATVFGKGGFEIASLAAGGAIVTLEAVLNRTVDNAYALVRPPGHHAMRHTGMGFCVFANIAIAVTAVRQTHGVERVAVVDWDVHPGNGTESIFYDDPGVLTISLHQDRIFEPWGAADKRGEGAGFGYSINLPLPPATGDAGYLAAFDQIVLPALRSYRPELIVVASGLDANIYDPLGRQMVTSDGFRALAGRILDIAAEVADSRIALVHEGGYNENYVPFCGLAIVETLAGVKTIVDPHQVYLAPTLPTSPRPHEATAIDRLRHDLTGTPLFPELDGSSN
jgi:acetoin utilization deacetylase AcuC-like enzyme